MIFFFISLHFPVTSVTRPHARPHFAPSKPQVSLRQTPGFVTANPRFRYGKPITFWEARITRMDTVTFFYSTFAS